ncbi:hypothetical protein Golomagni_01610 [Golovinomyces magnicellulatus]|nr:hypothetical protein Golomagni_01610 [Golovinomyces magnicellulatus]
MEIKSEFLFLKNLLVKNWRRLINSRTLMNKNSTLKLPLQREILGPWHPFQGSITGNETVWLFDNTAYQSAEGNWMAEFVVAVFSQDIPLGIENIFADIAQKIGLADTNESTAIIRDRLSPWLKDVLPGRIVQIHFGHQNYLSTSPGGANGISCDLYNLPNFSNGTIISSKANVPSGTDGLLKMKTLYAEPEGWGIISDIDDTIKVTHTDHPMGFINETFIATATPIEGMPELYADIVKLITPFSPFFYVSASPYNFYPFLSKFCQENYPQGTIMLPDLSLKNMKGLFPNHVFGPQAFKIDRIKKINSWLPRRKMICIGDSTQSDPEIYGEFSNFILPNDSFTFHPLLSLTRPRYRMFPGWIKLIMIRKATSFLGVKPRNTPKRFIKAFEGVERDHWFIFETPDECDIIIRKVIMVSRH